MNVALISENFFPIRNSGAIQLRDLALELLFQGHTCTVIVPTEGISENWKLEDISGVRVLRLKSLKTKDISFLRRTIAEFLMPFFMLRNYRKSPLSAEHWDGLIWYSPSIFFGPIVARLKYESACRSYLILRDIFPEWMADIGLIRRGISYRLLKAIANYQYSIADVIGIQSQGNKHFIPEQFKDRVEVLHNWLANSTNKGFTIALPNATLNPKILVSAIGPSSMNEKNNLKELKYINLVHLAGRIIFVYSGNMGVAQGMDVLIDLADRLRKRNDIGFLFVGRGSEVPRLKNEAEKRNLDNVLFHDEIDPTEMLELYSKCHIGLIALDPKHKTHNIPGKFLSYMQAGLPVLASINSDNDLGFLIQREGVGRVWNNNSINNLELAAIELVDEVVITIDKKSKYYVDTSLNCKALASSLFSPEVAVRQIVQALEV